MRYTSIKLLGVAALLSVASTAGAQDYPTRSIRMVVPFAAGGPTDSLARQVAERLAAHVKQPVVVENRPGAGGIPALESVVQLPADGYTLILTGQTTFTAQLTIKSNLDPQKELASIGQLTQIPLVIAAPVTAPFKDFREMIAYAKANPGKLSYGLSAHAGTDHLGFGQLEKAAGIKLNSIAYKGAIAVLPDLLAGRVDLQISTPALFAAHEQAGKLKMIAATNAKRIPLAAHVPTVAEMGYPGFNVPATFAMFVRTGTPAPIMSRLESEMKRIIEGADMVEPLRKLTLVPDFASGKETDAAMAEAYVSTRQLMQEMGFRLQ